MIQSLEAIQDIRPQVDAYVIMLGEGVDVTANALAEKWRDLLPDIRIQTHCGGGNMKKQMKRADKSGAQVALILGENEIENQEVTIKYLRGQQEQQSLAFEQVPDLLSKLI